MTPTRGGGGGGFCLCSTPPLKFVSVSAPPRPVRARDRPLRPHGGFRRRFRDGGGSGGGSGGRSAGGVCVGSDEVRRKVRGDLRAKSTAEPRDSALLGGRFSLRLLRALFRRHFGFLLRRRCGILDVAGPGGGAAPSAPAMRSSPARRLTRAQFPARCFASASRAMIRPQPPHDTRPTPSVGGNPSAGSTAPRSSARRMFCSATLAAAFEFARRLGGGLTRIAQRHHQSGPRLGVRIEGFFGERDGPGDSGGVGFRCGEEA